MSALGATGCKSAATKRLFSVKSRTPALFCSLLATTCLAFGAGQAHALETVVITISDTVENAGETVEVPIHIASLGTEPEVLILVVEFDPTLLAPATEYYEFVQSDLEGNVTTKLSAVRPSQALRDRDMIVLPSFDRRGAVSVAIFALGEITIPDGLLLTLALEIAPEAEEGQALGVRGDSRNSSAADGDASHLSLEMVNGEIRIGCTPPPAPGNIAASQGQGSGVTVTWSPIAELGAVYRVYRSRQDSPDTAMPLGEGWQTGTSFTDLSAEAPSLQPQPGCLVPDLAEHVNYHYWVRARRPDGCASAFSADSALGYRGAAKAATQSRLTPEALPAAGSVEGRLIAPPNAPLAVRLRAEAPLLPDSLWVEVQTEGSAHQPVYVVNANDVHDVWLVCTPRDAWAPGERITLRAGGTMEGTDALLEVVREFEITAGLESTQPVPLPQGLGHPLALEPAGVYDAPREFRLPVPAGVSPDQARLYFLDPSPGGAWHAAESVDGWLAAPARVEWSGGRADMVILARHGGVVQFATSSPGAPASATMLPIAPPALGTMLVYGILLTLLVCGGYACRSRQRFAAGRAEPGAHPRRVSRN